jgi:hypothetical protein
MRASYSHPVHQFGPQLVTGRFIESLTQDTPVLGDPGGIERASATPIIG